MAIKIVDTVPAMPRVEPVNKIPEPVNKKPELVNKIPGAKRGRPRLHPDRAAYRKEWMRRRRAAERAA
jgi:hypothetical protein